MKAKSKRSLQIAVLAGVGVFALAIATVGTFHVHKVFAHWLNNQLRVSQVVTSK